MRCPGNFQKSSGSHDLEPLDLVATALCASSHVLLEARGMHGR